MDLCFRFTPFEGVLQVSFAEGHRTKRARRALGYSPGANGSEGLASERELLEFQLFLITFFSFLSSENS